MAQWIEQGTTKAPVIDTPPPEGGWTRAVLRDRLGPPVVAYPVPTGGTLFTRKPSPDLVGTLKPNMRASFLCGWLVYGPALLVLPGEIIQWVEPQQVTENNGV